MVDVDFKHPDGHRQRIRKVSPIQTRRGAEAYEREVRNSLIAGSFGRKEVKGAPTLAKFAEEFLTTYAEANNKPSEVTSKRLILEGHLLPALGRRRVTDIGQRDIEAYKSRKLKAGLSPKTINNHLAVLHRMFTIAVEWGIIDHAPPVRRLRAPPPSFDFLTPRETEQLIAATEPQWRAMVITAFKTGLRFGELIALRWEDVDLKAARMMVRRAVARNVMGTPKGHRSRDIDLCDSVVKALRSHRHLRGELVFCQEDGSMLTTKRCMPPLWRACDNAGLRRIGWHTARHSCASCLVMRGAPLKAVQELLGHSDIRMTLRYAHLSRDAKKDTVKLLDLLDDPDETDVAEDVHGSGNLTATRLGASKKSSSTD